jgi:transcriptional regulator with XRE-family HTH domain
VIPETSTFAVEAGARLRQLRRETGKNQTQFGIDFGVSKNSQVDYEAGKSPFNVDYLGRLDAAGIDITYILTGRRAADSLVAAHSSIISKLQQLPQGWDRVILAILDQALTAPIDATRPSQDDHARR